ncbi:MAG: hypothetical protein HKN47_18515 [Pirellulaceae bacterium]|nr:hypothetical protein [Pirellulaceae bacterium]
MRQFFFGMICGAGLLFVAMHYHVVHGNHGITLVPKISNNLSDAYVDIREFSLDDWKEHKPLAAAIMRSNHGHLIEDSAQNAFADSMRGLVDSVFKSDE